MALKYTALSSTGIELHTVVAENRSEAYKQIKSYFAQPNSGDKRLRGYRLWLLNDEAIRACSDSDLQDNPLSKIGSQLSGIQADLNMVKHFARNAHTALSNGSLPPSQREAIALDLLDKLLAGIAHYQ